MFWSLTSFPALSTISTSVFHLSHMYPKHYVHTHTRTHTHSSIIGTITKNMIYVAKNWFQNWIYLCISIVSGQHNYKKLIGSRYIRSNGNSLNICLFLQPSTILIPRKDFVNSTENVHVIQLNWNTNYFSLSKELHRNNMEIIWSNCIIFETWSNFQLLSKLSSRHGKYIWRVLGHR